MQRAEHLIIGGGVAGTVAAETIRTRQPDARIVIVSAEDHPLYSRVLLPNYIKGKIPREKVFLRKVEQYQAKNIELLLGEDRRATSLDADAHTVTLADGSVWKYGKLLLAIGRQPKPPDIYPRHPAVCNFRTIDDADRIKQALETLAQLPEGKRAAVIVGSGYIALEFGPFFRMVGAETHLVMRANRFWEKVVTEEGSRVMEELLEKNGVILHRGTTVDSCGVNQEIVAVLSTGESIRCSAMGLGLGIADDDMNEGLLDSVELEDGIRTNEYLQTKLPDVFAAGDDASFFDLRSGRHVRLGNWQNADLQGRVAGENMCGARRVFDNVSQYSTKIFETVVAMAGDVSPDGPPPRVVSREGAHVEVRERDDAIIGAVMIGLVPERAAILAAIKNKQKSPV